MLVIVSVVDADTTMLGSRHSPTSTCSPDLVYPVSSNVKPQICWSEGFFACSGIPAWRRLIYHSLAESERVSLIKDLFSDRDEIEAIKHLSRDDAQSFVDVLDEVFHHSYPRRMAY